MDEGGFDQLSVNNIINMGKMVMGKWLKLVLYLVLFVICFREYPALAAGEKKPSTNEATTGITKPPSGFTAMVAHQGDKVVLRDAMGNIVAQKHEGDDDAGLIQQAVDSCRKDGGEVRLLAGKYDLKKSIILDFPCTLSGEGRGTVLVPPPNDYALRLMRTDRTPSLIYIWGPQKVSKEMVTVANTFLLGVKVNSLAIIGYDHGKGIFLSHIGESILTDLWIHATPDGAAIYADYSVLESYFTNIYCVRNGNVKNREGTIVIRSQDDGDANNNLHFTNVHVIYPNYTGLEIGSEDKKCNPRLLFFTECFFHGTLPIENASPYDLIHVKATLLELGISISGSRITHTGKDNALVHVENGAVDVTNCIIGGGTGKTIIKADQGAKISVTGNTFQNLYDPKWNKQESACLDATGADIIFAQNKIDPKCWITLKDPVSAIVTANRFGRTPRERSHCLHPQTMVRWEKADKNFWKCVYACPRS